MDGGRGCDDSPTAPNARRDRFARLEIVRRALVRSVQRYFHCRFSEQDFVKHNEVGNGAGLLCAGMLRNTWNTRIPKPSQARGLEPL